jgi:mono/diheme cytochrome c family protein
MTSFRMSHLVFVVLMAAGLAAFVCTDLSTARAEDQTPWEAPPRAARKKNPVTSDAASITAGKEVYAKQCLSCHGEKGKGDGPASKELNPKPHNLSDDAVVKQTDGALFWKITEGRKPMPTFDKTISETERWQVINYVRTLAKQ